MTVLEAKGIHKSYFNGHKGLKVLKGIDIKIAKGTFSAIVGPSGAGKSTLLHILGGLDVPTSGSVFFEGKDLYRLSDNALCRLRNRQIGFVFQFYHLLPEFNALENVALPGLIGRGPALKAAGIKEKAKAILKKVGLSERLDYFPSQLSGGEKQRVAIARALTNEPGLLLCDEPTGNLDSKMGSDIVGLIRELSRENGMTVVMVTHNMDLAKIADKVYSLKDGVLEN